MKNFVRLSVFVLVAVLSFTVFGNVTSVVAETRVNDEAYDYPVKPGTLEWEQLTPEERRASCIVPLEVLESMTTRALLETAMNYPYFADFFAFDNSELGTESLIQGGNNALQELLRRSDVMTEFQTLQNVQSQSRAMGFQEVKLVSYLTMDATMFAMDIILSPTVPRIESFLYTEDSITAPNGQSVGIKYGVTWSDHPYPQVYYQSAHDSYASTYPNNTTIAQISPVYNCHNYAWNPSQTAGWINEPNNFWNKPGFSGNYELCTVVVGAKIVYFQGSYALHSGIVVGVSQGSNAYPRVVSKWGACGLYQHYSNDSPYYAQATSGCKFYTK